jgi:hypothetical protein
MNDAATTADGNILRSSDAFSESPREIVETLASNKIKGFLGTIGDDGQYLNRFAQSLAGQTTNVATDYRDRFLVELIQNAYDAQPIGRNDGRIEITLDMGASEYGTLYVANTGQPFAKGNVESLSYVALSAKSVGQAIGNKGLGFRSIVQITDEPSVFSQLPEAIDPKGTSINSEPPNGTAMKTITYGAIIDHLWY